MIGTGILSSCSHGGTGRDPGRRNMSSQTTSIITESNVDVPSKPKPIVNVFIENSASMDGYVKGVTEFESTIYNYLTNIKISQLTDSLNLFYINSKLIRQAPDVEDFIKKLEPSTFKQKGGNRGSTDISDLLKMVLKETTGDNVSIVVSDFIPSPGKGKDAEEYLMNQQIGIKRNVAEYLNGNSDAAVCIYQFFSKFTGTYFNREDYPTQISDLRPFYLWVIGNKSHIRLFKEKIDVKFSDDLKNSYILEAFDDNVNYTVVASKFCKKIKGNLHACVVKPDRNNQISFSVDINLSNSIMDDKYLCNPDNYDISDPDMSIVGIRRSSSHAYTHTITFASNKVKSQTLSVSLKTCIPEWVDIYTDTEGLDIKKGDAMNQTYGLKHLIKGAYEAFTFNGDTCFTISININK